MFHPRKADGRTSWLPAQCALVRATGSQSLSTWRASPALKTGAGVVNAIRVTLKGNSISTYFNDQLFYTVTGNQPKGGGFLGFAFESEKAGPNTWSFTNLKVTDAP